MGSPLGPLLANVLMGSMEETLVHEGKMPSSYEIYVDDTLTIMPDTASAATFLSVQAEYYYFFTHFRLKIFL